MTGTDEDLQKLRAITAATTPGPWGADCESGGRVCDGHCGDPIPEARGYGPASTHVHCQTIATDMDFHVSIEHAHANARFIAAARDAVPALIDEVERLRSRPWERLRDLGFNVDETGLKRQHAMESEIVTLTEALTEALDIFDATWCSDHGHAPRPAQLARIAELRKTSVRS